MSALTLDSSLLMSALTFVSRVEILQKVSGGINKLESKVNADFNPIISKLTSLESRMDTYETLASGRHQVILRELTRLQK